MFTSILGDEAGNLALKVLATGGIYLAGGMATHALPELKSQRFMQAFKNKGRFAEMMGRMPIHVIVTRAAIGRRGRIRVGELRARLRAGTQGIGS